MNKVKILGVAFDHQTFAQFQKLLTKRVEEHRSTFVVTANPEIVMAANTDPKFMHILQTQADLITADGIGIIKAAQLLGHPLPERVTGYDLFTWLLKLADQKKLRVYLIGARSRVIHAVQAKIARHYSHLNLVGAQDGYFKESLNEIAECIKRTQPDLVFAALGFPKQEELLALLRQQDVPALMMGVGGSFDVFAGFVKRAPAIFQRSHLEWFYRLLTNPWRWRRMLVLPQFMMRVHQVKRGQKRQ